MKVRTLSRSLGLVLVALGLAGCGGFGGLDALKDAGPTINRVSSEIGSIRLATTIRRSDVATIYMDACREDFAKRYEGAPVEGPIRIDPKTYCEEALGVIEDVEASWRQ